MVINKEKEKTYSFDELANLIAEDMGLKKGNYHMNLNIIGEESNSAYCFTFSEPKGETK